MTIDQPRTAAGTPRGGQFASISRTDSDVTLTPAGPFGPGDADAVRAAIAAQSIGAFDALRQVNHIAFEDLGISVVEAGDFDADWGLLEDEHFDPYDYPVRDIPMSAIVGTSQTNGLTAEALTFYLDHPVGELYDPDGWFGNSEPVLIGDGEGHYLLQDGNHRFSAAWLRGETHLRAHAVE